MEWQLIGIVLEKCPPPPPNPASCSVSDLDLHGSTFIWLSWISIRIQEQEN
jgi:hypothetical protein